MSVTLGANKADNIEQAISGNCTLMSSFHSNIQDTKTVSEFSSAVTYTPEGVSRLENDYISRAKASCKPGQCNPTTKTAELNTTMNRLGLEIIPTFNGDKVKWTFI